MIKFAVFAILIALPDTRQEDIETIPVRIIQQLNYTQTTDAVSQLTFDNYDSIDVKKMPVTPVQEKEEGARDEKYRLSQSTAETFTIHSNVKRPKNNNEKPVDTFSRRVFGRALNEEQKNTPLSWLHCQDVITPYLKGTKNEFEGRQVVDENHRTVTRLIHLLNLDTTAYDKSEISHILHQVNELELRLFQWTPEAIRALFRVINRGEKHTFRRLTQGLREVFNGWHIDYSNITNLLRQSRIFRPICITGKDDQSSTKTPSGSRYAKLTESTVTSENEDINDRK